ncbi:MAG TPA: methylated-DNA--[protein]-cysteine S-methyltransferase, partial [Planctomycetota bacterium]|nr:methylated-DNA--[protein]-cysteine S-methyltransferase [Planctomycetota bacterium]
MPTRCGLRRSASLFGGALRARRETLALGTTSTRLGAVHVAASSRGVVAVSLPGEEPRQFRLRVLRETQGATLVEERTPVVDRALRQISQYFTGRRRRFRVPIDLRVGPFAKRVLRALDRVPFGATVTYGSLARSIASPRAARAVGAALSRNPVPIVLGCHRVVASDGGIGGFGGALGALEMKR